MPMMVSIVVPIFNAEKTLRRCIDSCLAQTYKSVEVICVNDGSRDQTAKILSSYGMAIRTICQSNSGVVVARSKGVYAARGEWIYFLDADDYLPITAIADLVAHMDAETDVIFGNQVVVNGGYSEERVLLPRAQMSGVEYSDYSLEHGQGTIGGKMFRKALCEKLKINPCYQLNEDLLMNIQIGLMARVVRYCAKPNYYYWWESEGSLSKQVNVRSIGSVMTVNREIKEMLTTTSCARFILDSGYVMYSLRNAAKLYALNFDAPDMYFVLREVRYIAIRHPVRFMREALRRKSCALPFVAQLLGLSFGRMCYRLILKLQEKMRGK